MPTLWYQPQSSRDAVDCIEHVATVVSFVHESIAFSQEKEYHLSDVAAAGLCNVLMLVEGVLDDCNKMLLKEACYGNRQC